MPDTNQKILQGNKPARRAVIFANGSLPDPAAARRLLKPDDLLIAADGGLRHLSALGRSAHLLIGDLDSVTGGERAAAETAGAQVLQFPRDKDETDLELALLEAQRRGFATIRIAAALGGRLDQTLANLTLLADSRWQGCDLRIDDGLEEAFFIRSRGEVRGRPGDTVSLLAWGRPAVAVATRGLAWPLDREPLLPGSTRGVSNRLTGSRAEVRIAAGLLLCIHRRDAAEHSEKEGSRS